MTRRVRPVIALGFPLLIVTATLGSEVTPLPLPGAPEGGVVLDYLAIDRGRHRVWVPAGGTGNAVVIDTATQGIQTVDKFPTKEVERRGQKRVVGLSSATVGDGVVYVGNRADSSVCAIDATTLARGGCLTLPSSPDGLAYIASRKEVWITAPRDKSLLVLDVSIPDTPKLSGSITLEGEPEGYAVDNARGVFYTNLEDKDKTLRIDLTTRKVTATWNPSCGQDGPKGLAIEPDGQWLMLACSDHVEVLAAGTDGHIVSKLKTGEGVDNIDYVTGRHALYAAAAGAATLTVASVSSKGKLSKTATIATAKGARNAVATDDGAAYVANGSAGKILLVRPAQAH
jgi:hypothetical protein